MTTGVNSMDVAAAPGTDAARLRRISTHDFRNLRALDVALPAAGAVLVGENGQGKSNLLEAIYYGHLFRSMRGARDEELVRFGTAGFLVAWRRRERHTIRSAWATSAPRGARRWCSTVSPARG